MTIHQKFRRFGSKLKWTEPENWLDKKAAHRYQQYLCAASIIISNNQPLVVKQLAKKWKSRINELMLFVVAVWWGRWNGLGAPVGVEKDWRWFANLQSIKDTLKDTKMGGWGGQTVRWGWKLIVCTLYHKILIKFISLLTLTQWCDFISPMWFWTSIQMLHI